MSKINEKKINELMDKVYFNKNEIPINDIDLFNENDNGEIKIKEYDLNGHYFVKIGANRENSRIIRVTRTFLKAATLVGEENESHIPIFYRSILEILDHKGCLMVNWKSREAFNFFRKNIEKAWCDENEFHIWHFINVDDMVGHDCPYVEVA